MKLANILMWTSEGITRLIVINRIYINKPGQTETLLGDKIKSIIAATGVFFLYIAYMICVGQHYITTVASSLIFIGYIIFAIGDEWTNAFTVEALEVSCCTALKLMSEALMFFCIKNQRGSLARIYAGLMSLMFLFILLRLCHKKDLYHMIMHFDKKISNTIFLVIAEIFAIISLYNLSKTVDLRIYFLCITLIIILAAAIVSWQRMWQETEKLKNEIIIWKNYSPKYEEMIKQMQIKQHNYKNNLIMLRHTNIKYKDDRIIDNILFKCRDEVVSAFLYEKIKMIKTENINVLTQISIYSRVQKQADTLEALGIMLDNAMEKEKDYRGKKQIELCVEQKKDIIDIAVINHCEYMSVKDIKKMFEFGYSTKGDGRGIGMYRLKQLAGKTLTVENLKNKIKIKVTI